MRVMVIVKASKESEAGQMPSEKVLTVMGTFNEELVKAGVMLAGDGLHPSSKGKRVRFSGADRILIAGSFAATKELIAGFWLWRVKSMEERSTGSRVRRSEAGPKWTFAAYSKPRTSAGSSRQSSERRRSVLVPKLG